MITDIMSSDIDTDGVAEFTSDADVLEVAVIPPGAGGLVFSNGNGSAFFQNGENFLLTGASLNIPYGFGEGTGKAYIGIAWKNDDGDQVTIPELSGNSILVFPDFCCTIDFPPSGIYIACPLTGGPWYLALTNIVMNVSQVGLPNVLDDQVFKVQFHLKINHTRALLSGG